MAGLGHADSPGTLVAYNPPMETTRPNAEAEALVAQAQDPAASLPPPTRPQPLPMQWVYDWVRAPDGTPVFRIRVFGPFGHHEYFIPDPSTQLLPEMLQAAQNRPPDLTIARSPLSWNNGKP